MTTESNREYGLISQACKELGCTNIRVLVDGVHLKVFARWERDSNIVGVLKVSLTPSRSDHLKGSVLEKFFELNDGLYQGGV